MKLTHTAQQRITYEEAKRRGKEKRLAERRIRTLEDRVESLEEQVEKLLQIVNAQKLKTE